MEHRLAAVLMADVVGYSRLMEADEAGTLAAVKERRTAVLEPTVRAHGGRIVKVMGDGVLIEFGSAVNAVAGGDGLATQDGARPTRRLPEERRDRPAHRHQSRRRDRRGRRHLRRGRQHRRAARSAGRAGRHLHLGQGPRGGARQARLRVRGHGRADGQEHLAARAGLSPAPGLGAATAPSPPGRSAFRTSRRSPSCRSRT